MEIRILGPIELWHGDHRRQLGRVKERSLLGVLALHAGRPVSLPTLMKALWDDPPAHAKKDLQAYVSRLRGSLRQADASAAITTEHGGYLLDAGDDIVDFVVFKELRAAARTAQQHGDLDEAAARLSAAIALWRGEPLQDLRTSWMEQEREDLVDYERLAGYQALCDIELRRGNFRDALRLVEETGDHEFDVTHIAHKLTAFDGLGRYRDFDSYWNFIYRKTIKSFGTGPDRELQELHGRLLQERDELVPALQRGREGSFSSRPPAQLPPAASDFVGRQSELTRLDDLLLRSQAIPPDGPLVIVITGPAGVGKTTLAVKWAHSIKAQFPHGQLHTNLGGYSRSLPTEPELVLADMLTAMGVSASEIPPSATARSNLLRTILDERRVLLLLDNARNSEQVYPLLPGSAQCVIVITSRHRLTDLSNDLGAYRVPVEPMNNHEATLLVSAILATHGTQLDVSSLNALGAVSEGSPVAVRIVSELAVDALAAKPPVLPTTSDVLQVGEDGAGTIFTSLRWSYDALLPHAGRLFRLLSLHPGRDIDLATASVLNDASPEQTRGHLSMLTGLHLLGQHGDRYFFRPMVREFAVYCASAEGEPDAELAELRVLDWYLSQARAAEYTFTHKAQDAGEGALWFGAERDAIIALARRAARAPHQHAWELLAALHAAMRSSEPLQDWLEVHQAVLEAARRVGDRSGQAWTLNGLAILENRINRSTDIAAWLHTARDLFHDDGNLDGELESLQLLANLARQKHDAAGVLDYRRQALAVHATIDDPPRLAVLHLELGRAYLQLARHHEACTHLEEASAFFESVGDHTRLISARTALGVLAKNEGRDLEAMAILEAVSAERDGTAERQDLLQSLVLLSEMSCDRELYSDTLAYARHALGLCHPTTDRQFSIRSVVALVRALHHTGKVAEAFSEARQALALIAEVDDPINETVREQFAALGLNFDK